MTKDEALKFVVAEIERIEHENAGKELKPWEPDACAAATEHWGRVQQRIALTTPRGSTACLEEFDLPVKPMSEESKRHLRNLNQKRKGG